MFIKLFKHDFLDLKNSFLVLFIVVGVVSFTIPLIWDTLVELVFKKINNGDAYSMSLFVLLFVLLAIFFYVVVTLYIITTIKYFTRSFFSNEGYFTLTLPVSTTKNVISKMLSIIIWYILFVLVAVVGLSVSLSLIVLIDNSVSFKDFIEGLKETFYPYGNSFKVGELIYSIFDSLLTNVLSLCGILFCITLAHTKKLNKHVVLNTILLLIASLIIYGLYQKLCLSYITNQVAYKIVNISFSTSLSILLGFFIVKLIDHKIELQ